MAILNQWWHNKFYSTHHCQTMARQLSNSAVAHLTVTCLAVATTTLVLSMLRCISISICL